MLLIVSDLHFVDGSAGESNLSPRTYEKVFASLNLIERIDRLQELEVVFLGDTFDTLRSRAWFDVRVEEAQEHRPWNEWSDPDSAGVSMNRNMLRRVLSNDRVRATCNVFCEWKKRLQDPGLPVRYRLIPGNHDRFLHADPVARRDVVEALHLDDNVKRGFEYLFCAPDYRTVAFHGHELDPFNFGRGWWESDPFSPNAYSSPSIGEAITIDVMTRIPFEAEERLRSAGLDKTFLNTVIDRLDNIENIRPVSSIFSWLDYIGRQSGSSITRLLDEAVRSVFSSFARSDYVKNWSTRLGDHWLPHSASNIRKLAAKAIHRDFSGFLDNIRNVSGAKHLVSGHRYDATGIERYEYIAAHPFHRRLSTALSDMDTDRRYIVYGHTHSPEIVHLSGSPSELTLINTGTFQPRMHECRGNGSRYGFIPQKSLSFSVFYLDGEIGRNGEQQYYEFWEGHLSEDLGTRHIEAKRDGAAIESLSEYA